MYGARYFAPFCPAFLWKDIFGEGSSNIEMENDYIIYARAGL